MFAVIKTGGKQYRVAIGEKLRVESVSAEIGSEFILKNVLAIGGGGDLMVGAPILENVHVTAKVLAHGRGEKVQIFKMRRRKHYQKHQGHRQNFTEVEITAIKG